MNSINPNGEVKVNQTHVSKETSFELHKNLCNKADIKETITLSSSDWLGIENGLIKVVNSYTTKYINPKYYTVVPITETQKELIQKVQPLIVQNPVVAQNNKSSVSVDYELKGLNTIGLLINKIKACNKHKEQAQNTKSKDTIYLLNKKIKSEEEYIQKYLNSLKADKNFSVKDNYFVYSGQFVNAKKKIPEGGF
jgi:hypothetical protein